MTKCCKEKRRKAWTEKHANKEMQRRVVARTNTCSTNKEESQRIMGTEHNYVAVTWVVNGET